MIPDPPEGPPRLFERAASLPGVAFLDGRAGVARAPLSHLAWNPSRRLRVNANGEATIDERPAGGDPVAAIDDFLELESAAGRTVIGAIGYDLRYWLEPRSGGRPRTGLPIVLLASYESCCTYDHRRGEWRSPPPPLPPAPAGKAVVSEFRPRLTRADYVQRFERVSAWIAAGDVYQVNLAIPFDAKICGRPAALYERVARLNPVPYGAFLDFGPLKILSNSPELFLERRGSRIATRPIKGTRPRGGSPADDERLVAELRSDPKERAEHLMIVDLERNDLGRIAETGSVGVEDFEAIETYSTLHHLESTVTARMVAGTRFPDCLRAMFPGGSITGAPKIRAMQILDELETVGRGFYTGSILYHPPDRNFTMSICIRTATVVGDRISYSAGSGVVADSVADLEYDECLLKARAFQRATRRDAEARSA